MDIGNSRYQAPNERFRKDTVAFQRKEKPIHYCVSNHVSKAVTERAACILKHIKFIVS